MPSRRTILWAVGFVVAVGLVAPTSAQPVEPAGGDLARSIARIVRGEPPEGPCSGVFIARDRVLTAGHCVTAGPAWTAALEPPLQVVLGGERFAVEAVRLAPESPFDAAGQIRDLGQDWAVLSVTPPPRGRVVPLRYVGSDAARVAFVGEEPLLKAGFAAGRGLRTTPACRPTALATNSRSFEFRCPGGLGDGQSGAALLVKTADGYGVVGLQSGRAERPALTIGIAATPPVAAVRTR